MAVQEKWYFTREQLKNSPSRKCGLDGDKELAYRQQAANLIQDMGQRLQVSQLCINTAIVYMHRFYAFHSFTQFHRNAMAAAALFLAAKVEEQPRKLEYVIKVAHVCLHRGESSASLDPRSDHYQEQAQDLVFNENVLLQTLGFDVAIDHPHTHVVRTCHLVKAPKDLAQTSYFMASNSLHLTTMCLQYQPTVVACFCIHLASKWSHWAIPQSNEGRHWFQYVDRLVTMELLEKLTAEFLHIFDKCPSRLKRKMMSISSSSSSPHSSVGPGGVSHQQQPVVSSPFDPKKTHITDDMEKSFDKEYEREKRRAVAQAGGYVPAATSAAPPAKMDFREYREKKEREERERRQAAAARVPTRPAPPHRAPPPHKWPHHKQPPPNHHHRPPSNSQPGAPPISASGSSSSTNNTTARARPPSLFSPESTSTAPRRPPSTNVPNVNVPSAVPTAPNVVRRPPAPIASSQTQIQPPQVQPSSASANVNAVPPVVTPQVPSQPAPVHQQHRKREVVPPVNQSLQPPVGVARDLAPPPPVSPFASPPPASTPKRPARPRTSSSSSEPELIPVVKKLDETPGFENIIRDSQRHSGIRVKPPALQAAPTASSPSRQSLNGIETDPAMVSNLLKESLFQTTPVPEVPPIVAEVPPPIPEPALPPVAPVVAPTPSGDDHHHRSEKKKKKEKHKHKDRDKPRDERKKHKKDKDKEKKKEKSESVAPPVNVVPPPIENEQHHVAPGGLPGGLKITIPRDKLASSPGLKIKIPKERLASAPMVPPPQHMQPVVHHPPGLKIKIPKEVLDGSRKRSVPMEQHPIPAKLPRHNGVPHHHHHHKVPHAVVGNGHAPAK